MTVHGPGRITRHLVAIGADERCRRYPFHVATCIERTAEQEPLFHRVGRRNEIQPAALLIHSNEFRDIERAGGQVDKSTSVARHPIQVTPSVTLALPDERVAFVEPGYVLYIFDVVQLLLHEHRTDLSGCRVRVIHAVRVLLAIQLLNDDLVRTCGPAHARHVVLTRIAREVRPHRAAALHRHHPDACSRHGLANLRVRNSCEHGVELVGRVDQREIPHARRIELPVRNAGAVRTPAETVADGELLFVGPAHDAVDDVVGAATRKLPNATIRKRFHVHVGVAHVGNAIAVRRELCKLQG